MQKKFAFPFMSFFKKVYLLFIESVFLLLAFHFLTLLFKYYNFAVNRANYLTAQSISQYSP